ncbi:MAG: leucyl/phenylalanyl-tRNA--protein transferase [Sphingomonadaceae bacterium]
MGEVIEPDILLRAYASGVFPMADARDADEVYWVDPEKRGIMPLDRFRLSKSLAKTLRSERFETTVDRAFEQIVALCAAPADDRPSTWINGHIERAVTALHAAGYAHSIETWLQGELVGGLYGIALGGAFFGESMFSRATDASKVALAHLVARLRVGGFALLDCQFITPHLASMGAIEISRADYMASLSSALRRAPDFLAFGASPPRTTSVLGPVSGWRIAQSLVQTS